MSESSNVLMPELEAQKQEQASHESGIQAPNAPPAAGNKQGSVSEQASVAYGHAGLLAGQDDRGRQPIPPAPGQIGSGNTDAETQQRQLDELSAALVNMPQAGLQTPLLPPIDDDEPEAKGYTSSRQWIALPSSIMMGHKKLEFSFGKVAWPKSFGGEVASQSLNTYDMAEMMSNEELRARFDCNRQLLDLRSVVFGVTKGVMRATRVVGRVLERCGESVAIREGEHLASPSALTVEPGYAAAFVETIDENTIKARRVIAGVFPDATNMLTEVMDVCRHGREMLDGKVETTRFVMRLAAMLVETAMIDMCAGHRYTWDTDAPPTIQDCITWVAFRRGMMEDAENHVEKNYVPWVAMKGYCMPQEKIYVDVLRFACASKVSFRGRTGNAEPYMWPAITNCVFYTGYALEKSDYTRCQYNFSVNDIWVAARLWCHRYSDAKILDQMVQTYLMLFWRVRGRPGRLIMAADKLAMRLPHSHMRGFVMSPFLQARDNMVKAMASVAATGMVEKIAETTMASYLIGFAGDWCRWTLLDYTIVNLEPTRDELRIMASLLRGTEEWGHYWPALQQFLSGLGYKGDVGKWVATIVSRQTTGDTRAQSTRMVTGRMHSTDLLGMFKNLPHGCAAQGIVAPLSFPSTVAISGNTTCFSDLPKANRQHLMATLYETTGVEFVRVVADRNLPSVRSTFIEQPLVNWRAYPQDHPMMALTDKAGHRVRFGFRLNHSAAFALGDEKHDRFTMTWYVTKRKIGDIMYRPMASVLNPEVGAEINEMGGKMPKEPSAFIQEMSDSESDDEYGAHEFEADRIVSDSSIHSDSEYDLEPEEPAPATRTAVSTAEQPPPRPHQIKYLTSVPEEVARIEKEVAKEVQLNQLLAKEERRRKAVSEKKKRQRASKAAAKEPPGPGLRGGNRRQPSKGSGVGDAPCSGNEWLARKRRDDEPDDAAAAALLAGNHPCVRERVEYSHEWTRGDVIIDEPMRRQMLEMALRSVSCEEAWRWLVGVCRIWPSMSVNCEKQLLQWADAVLTGPVTGVPSTESALLGESIPEQITRGCAEDMLLQADAAVSRFAWKAKAYTVEENKLLGLAREISNPRPAVLAVAALAEAMEVLNTDFEPNRCLAMACELGAMQMEYKQTIQQQFEARKQAERLGIACPEAPVLLECGCLFEVASENVAAPGRTHEEQVRGWRIGACPRSLVRRFGGKWRTRKGLMGRKQLTDTDCGACIITGSRGYTWFLSLSKKEKARYLLECHPASIGPEHFQLLGARCSPVPEGRAIQPVGEQSRQELAAEAIRASDWGADRKFSQLGGLIRQLYGTSTDRTTDMDRRPSKGGFPYTLTAGMVSTACPGLEPLMELLHNNSPASDESEVAGTALALACLPVAVLKEVVAHGWLEVPLARWYIELKQPLTDIRRSLMFGEVRGEQLLKLRKLLNVTIRQTGDSDVGLENYNRAALVTRKHWYGWWAPKGQGRSGFAVYEEKFQHYARVVILKCLLAMPIDVRNKRIAEFWEERALRGASGASKAIKKVELNIPELAGGDRPGKKTLVEFLDDHALLRALRSEPTNRAYYFVKPEPGLKLRSLFAAYDEEAFGSSYGNQSVENSMGAERGIMVRQTPADVIEWMAASNGGLAGPEAEGAYWLSTDYSDYNSEHTQWEMAILDRTFGTLLMDGSAGVVNYEKAFAHFWTAAGRVRTYVIYGLPQKFRELPGVLWDETIGGYTPMINGLYSGSRTTARDNTWIHAIDVRIGREMLEAFTGMEAMKWVAICGDDEDIAFDGEYTAAVYYTTLAPMGHNLNPVKQLAGYDNHEFLQLTSARKERVEKPLNTLLATLATGNWYVQSGVWIQTAINGVVNNYWECFCRGMPLQVARRLAATTLDKAMHVKVDLNGDHLDAEANVVRKDLEWWKFRHSNALPPLFRFTEESKVEQPPQFEAVARPSEGWPSNASK